ncbi:hypothetical protein ACSBR2_005022 [Camellia fascicularis]
MNDPWLLAGDFIDIASQGEKRSFNSNASQARTHKFVARMNRCKLMDLGCSGPNLTWSNGRQGMANMLERLDRAVCNTEWRAAFSEGAVQNLPRTYSDHSPMVVYTQDLLANMGADQLEPLVVVDEPPIAIRSQIVADMVGMAYRRI